MLGAYSARLGTATEDWERPTTMDCEPSRLTATTNAKRRLSAALHKYAHLFPGWVPTRLEIGALSIFETVRLPGCGEKAGMQLLMTIRNPRPTSRGPRRVHGVSMG